MDDNEQFIILMVADTFLTHDYESCMRYTSCNYSVLANSVLFESNLLRFFALTSFKAYEHAKHKDPTSVNDNFNLLIQALKSAKQALELYESTNDGMEGDCPYGKALSNYTIGYIYNHFADDLCNNEAKN